METSAKAPLILTMGDPAGCGPQITAAAWAALRNQDRYRFAVIGPLNVYADLCPAAPIEALAQASTVFADALPVLDALPRTGTITAGQPNKGANPAILASIEQAVQFLRDGKASALVTNPINKAELYATGFEYPGHTEFLAALCRSGTAPLSRPVMMLVGGGLRVALATIHMPLIEAAKSLDETMLMETAQIVDVALKQDFGLSKPRLAFTGLNPHAGEAGTLGTEEVDIINPAAQKLRAAGIDISDARSADTVFAETLQGQFDAVIAMTHDQGLIPVKTLDFWGGVNTTLGLPIIRTSPDHGTAYDAAKSGTCRADSLIAAIKLAATNASHRACSASSN